MSMFEKAARRKLRFPYKGQSSVEDLWDLTPNQLDGIFTRLRSQQKEAEQESLLTPNSGDPTLNLQIEIVRRIVTVKLAEKEARTKAAATRARNRKIEEILERKEDEELLNKTPEQLRAMLSS